MKPAEAIAPPIADISLTCFPYKSPIAEATEMLPRNSLIFGTKTYAFRNKHTTIPKQPIA